MATPQVLITTKKHTEEQRSCPPGGNDARAQRLAALPVTERRRQLAGVATAVLEGGDGPPVVLLHGPGRYAAHWMRVLPGLVTTPLGTDGIERGSTAMSGRIHSEAFKTINRI